MSELSPSQSHGMARPVPEEHGQPYEVVDFLNKEADNRRYHLETERQNQQQSHEYAMKALDAQKATITLAIESEVRDKKWRYVLWGVVFIVVVGLVMFLVWQGNAKLAEEIVKALIFLISGGFGGWGLARHKQDNKPTGQ